MDLCNQVLAQTYLFQQKFSSKRFNKKISIKTSKKIDEQVAVLLVQGFGGTLTKLTKQQSKYLGVNIDGPFKNDDYSY